MLEFIVGRLREDPFGIAIRAVDFDAKRPEEHLQILNDVIATLKPDLKADVRASSRDGVAEEMSLFLMTHKCTCLPSDEDGFRRKETMYPVLHWVLSEYENLRKRTYLSRYLIPVDVPLEYLSMQTNGNLEELLEAYKELQEEFIEVHKQYEFTVASVDRPASDIINGIMKMEADEKQVLDRLQREQAQMSSNSNFQRLLAEASEMRQAQDDKIRLEGQKREQLNCFASAKQQLKQSRHILEVIENCEGKTSDLDREFDLAVHHLETTILPQRRNLEVMLLQAEKKAVSDKTEQNMADVGEMATQLEEILSQRQNELDNLGGLGGNMAILKKETNDAAAKFQAVRDDVEGKTLFREMLVSTDNELRKSVSFLDGDKEIHRSYDVTNFVTLQESVRLNTEVCEASKQEIANIQESIAELRQTENALKNQHLDLLDQCRKEEERGGVAGFQDIHEQLIAASKETSSTNELTSQMVDEMSEMSQKITRTLVEKKQELEPKVRQIKEKREHVQELQERYKSEKAKYDENMTKLTAEIRVLESECSRRQKDWLEKERSLCAKDGITTSNVATLPELGNLTKERREQGVNQLTEFTNLKKLLELLQAGVPRQ